MGHRIELNEIELAINEIIGVKEVVVFPIVKNDNTLIIAVISVGTNIKKDYIYDFLQKKIPNYMIPSNIFLVKKLLKNSNGKLDRKKISKIYAKKTII